MADVYLAEQRSLRRNVAIKILKPELATDERYVKRFHIEAQAAAGLSHANIVQIHEVGCIDGLHYIAQEYVSGKNLREILDAHGPLKPSLAYRVLCQVSAALKKAAEQRIVHRDVKPENIMLSEAGEVKVADFGLARLSDGTTDLTQIGITMGTPLYMSPEQVEGKVLDPRSDIYSLGVTSYHVLTGEPPFVAENALGVAVQHLKREPAPLTALRPDLSSEFCALIHKMLEKDPGRRFSGGGELLLSLQKLPEASLEPDMSQIMPALTPAATAATSLLGLAATQQLQAVMIEESPLIRARGGAIFAVAVLFVALGAAIAWRTREPPLVAARPELAEIEKLGDAWAQLYHAKKTDSEAAWKKVRTYWGSERYFDTVATQGLSMYYMEHNRLEDAWQSFRELSLTDDVPTRAFGIAGMCIVLHQQGKRDECDVYRGRMNAPMRDSLKQLYPRLWELFDRTFPGESGATTEEDLPAAAGSGQEST
jgi:serine/threonine-protein kinase